MLQEQGATVAYCDPHIPFARKGRKHDLGLASVPCSAEEFGKYDALVISTAHTAFKNPALYGNAKIVVDTRNIVQPAAVTTGKLYGA